MKPLQNTKIVAITPPAAIVDNASFTTAAIDTAGYNYAMIVVQLGSTDIAMTALKVQESDASDMTGAADVTGLVFGTSTNIAGSTSALPVATDDNKFQCFEVNLTGRKRYLDVVATGGDGTAGTYMSAFCILSSAASAPRTAAERGFDDILRV